MNKYTLSLLVVFSLIAPSVNCQTMQSDMLAKWETYIVVSSTLPRDQIISLAREASLANSVMVLNGFISKDNNFQEVQKFVAEINQECCTKQHPSRWVIDPKIIERYHITVAPSFVIGLGSSKRNEDYSVVSGDLDLANALKLFAQRSGSNSVRQHASSVYQQAFATH